jgi:phage shock protein E
MNSLSKKLLIVCAALLPLQACGDKAEPTTEAKPANAAPKAPAAPEQTAEKASAYADEDITWIDVRTPEEFAGRAVSKAINIPHTEITDKIAAVVADKNAPIYVYCRSGNRSGKAKAALEEIGYTNVINLGGVEHALDEAGEMD